MNQIREPEKTTHSKLTLNIGLHIGQFILWFTMQPPGNTAGTTNRNHVLLQEGGGKGCHTVKGISQAPPKQL